ncbi:MAG: 30S ribosomal protein S17 [Verrucomicrobia bacterium]|nr:30S ribosomal protein S17 [Verrucomicrobiota bacterium]MCF7707824.1 30S ribosomal protein S17 [Verrucomicrobiota bacterium]
MPHSIEKRGTRKTRIGEVVSNRMDKTIVVRVLRKYPHPLFRKVVKAHTRFYTHDENNEAKVGDRVLVRECRPFSKYKRWILVKILDRKPEVEIKPE